MKNYRRYVGVNDNIREAMQPTENGNALNSAIDFWNRRDQKFTFNEDQDTYFFNSFFPSFPSKAWNVLADAYQKIVFQKKEFLYRRISLSRVLVIVIVGIVIIVNILFNS